MQRRAAGTLQRVVRRTIATRSLSSFQSPPLVVNTNVAQRSLFLSDSAKLSRLAATRPLSSSLFARRKFSTDVDPVKQVVMTAEERQAADRLLAPIREVKTPSLHASTKEWVVFSDLHVHETTIDTCEQVLASIHAEAARRGAGIIFLGDFWHVRGSLSVSLLNRVMAALEKWTVPVVMIPGNHDQVTLGGHVHALEPLQYAFRPDQCLLFSEPTICMGALWLPYRRDKAVMEATLRQIWDRQDISMVYCHADVTGAWMNDNLQSRDGVSLAAFPPHIPVLSGHFHKPHMLSRGPSATVRYVGSPYQTSLGEAGQTKYLYALTKEKDDCLPWVEADRWPIALGRRHVKANGTSETAAMDALVAGDRLVLTVKLSEMEAADQLASRLRERGVAVEIRIDRTDLEQLMPAENSRAAMFNELLGSRLDSLADAAPENLWRAFLGDVRVAQLGAGGSGTYTLKSMALARGEEVDFNAEEAADGVAELRQRLLNTGLDILDKVSNQTVSGTAGGGISGTGAVGGRQFYDLRLDTLKLVNFGPYGGSEGVEYPLANRGLVLLRGQSMDGTGADSNGSGKTTLAMSALWCLTGSLDTRLANDGRNFDVSFDADPATEVATGTRGAPKRSASVTLRGFINDEPFEVTRRRVGKTQKLSFSVGGVDLTTHSVKDTQAEVDAKLGVGSGLLQRCFFFGQHSHTSASLLGLTDVKLKDEFSPLVNAEIWKRATEDARKVALDSEKLTVSLRTQYATRKGDLKVAETEELQARTILQAVEKDHYTLLSRLAKSTQNDTLRAELQAAENSDQLAQETLNRLRPEMLSLQLEISSQRETATRLRTEIAKFSLPQERSRLVGELRGAEKVLQDSKARRDKNDLGQKLERDAIEKKINSLLDEVRRNATQNPQTIDHLISLRTEPIVQFRTVEAQWRSEAKATEAEIALATVRRAEADAALRELRSIRDCHPDDNTSNGGSLNCPTCAQPLDAQQRVNRIAELEGIISQSEVISVRASHILTQQEKRLQWLDTLRIAREKEASLQPGPDMTSLEIARHQQVVDSLTSQLATIDLALQQADLDTKLAAAAEAERTIDMLSQRLAPLLAERNAAEETRGRLAAQISSLRHRVESQRVEESKLHSEAATVLERLEQRRARHAECLSRVQSLTTDVEDLKSHQQQADSVSSLHRRLEGLFGTRGVQHFLFDAAVAQLETQANSYLRLLTDGGLALRLSSDDAHEKILKSVAIRGSAAATAAATAAAVRKQQGGASSVGTAATGGGVWRERGLAQLSGGQWRRVSLALDLSFTELVRRRGLLRCNVMVMDEVLTHLDASGRAAVGSVLRALIDRSTSTHPAGSPLAAAAAIMEGMPQVEVLENNPKEQTETEKLSMHDRSSLVSPGLSTVLVILQDLAATELEEAFDRVDTVVKSGDASRVVVDK